MLGASQSQALTSIGINFWGSYGSANDPNNGRVVSDTAFGVPAADWTTSYEPADPDPDTWTYDAYVTSGTFIAGPVSVDYASGGNWFTGARPPDSPEVRPAETDVINGLLYEGATSGPGGTAGFTVTVTNLAATFPSGYVVQPIAAVAPATWSSPVSDFAPISVGDGTSTASLTYPVVRQAGGYFGPNSLIWALGDSSPTLTGNTLTLGGPAASGTSMSSLAGFIITDKPVITDCRPFVTSVANGSPFTLSCQAIGIGTLSYQWRRNGTDIPGANASSYSVASAVAPDSGSYDVVVTSSLFPVNPTTSTPVSVSVNGLSKWIGGIDNTWDIGLTGNWITDGVASSTYANGNIALFTDDGVADVNLVTAVTPASMKFENSVDYTISGAGSVGGGGGIEKTGTGRVTLYTVDNAFTGDTSITAGVLEIGASSRLGAATYPGDIANNGELLFNSSTDQMITGAVSGTGKITKSGTSTITLAGTGTGTGLTSVTAGTLEVQQKGNDSPYEVLAGGTLKLGYTTGGGYANTKIDIHGTAAADTTGLYLKGGTNYNVSGGMNLLDAPTTIRQHGTGAAGIGIFDINSVGLTCTAAASGSVVGPNVNFVQFGYGMAMQIEAGANTATGDLVLDGVLDVHGSGLGLIKRGAGSLRLNGAATAANEGVRIEAGSVITGINDAIGAGGWVSQTSSTATLVLNGTTQNLTSLTGSGHVVGGSASPSTLVLNSAVDLAYGGTLGGDGLDENQLALTKNGAGMLTLTGKNSYTGATSVLGGTLVAGPIPGSAISVADTTTLRIMGDVGSLAVASGGTVSPEGPPNVNDQFLRTATTATTTTTIATADFQELNNSTGTVIPNDTTYTYTGSIYLPDPAGTVYYFAESFDDGIVLTIDGSTVLALNDWNVTGSGSFTSPGPGWYPFSLRAIQGGGGVGPVPVTGWGPGKGVGFTTTAPVDPTDGTAYDAFTFANLTAAGIQIRTGSGNIESAANVTLAGTYLCDVNETGSDEIIANGDLNLTGSTLTVTPIGGGATLNTYVIATYTGTLTGAFATVQAPSGYSVNYNTALKQVELVGSGPAGFAAWIAGYPGLSDITPGGDPDHDGITNLMEYVLGGDPSVSGTAVLPVQTMDATNVTFTFKRRDDSESDTTQKVQWSTNLTGWTDIAIGAGNSSGVTIAENGASPDDVTVVIPRSNASPDGKLFVRLRVTQP